MVLILLGAAIFGDLIGALTSTVACLRHAGMSDAEYATAQNDDDAVDLPGLAVGCSGCFQIILLIGTAVAFCMWFYQANGTARDLGARGMEFSPGWAAGCFFVPIINMFRPYQAAQEIWKASDPDVPLDRPTGWRARSGSALIGLWWAAWILTNVLNQVSFRITWNAKTRDAAMVGEAVSVPADLISMAAAGLAMWWIWQVRQRQAKRYALVCNAGRPGSVT